MREFPLSLARPTVVVLALVGGGEEARAQAEPETRDAQAREVYLEGEAFYASGRYEEAAKAFHEAYRLSDRPQLLFNLGNAYERMGKLREAAGYLRRFVEDPRVRETMAPQELVSVRVRVVRLETAAEAAEARREAEKRREEERRRRADEAAARAAAEAERLRLNNEAAQQKRARSFPVGGIVAFSTSGAFASAAAVLGGVSYVQRGKLDEACVESAGGLLCPERVRGSVRLEKALALGSDVCTGLAAVSLAVGLYFSYVSRELAARSEVPPDGPAWTLGPSVFAGGIGLAVDTRF